MLKELFGRFNSFNSEGGSGEGFLTVSTFGVGCGGHLKEKELIFNRTDFNSFYLGGGCGQRTV